MARSSFLDWARVLAAQIVCLAHLRAWFLPDYKSASSHPLWFDALAFVTGFSGFAVTVFFVISGWQVGGQLIGRRFSAADLARYTIDRMARFGCVLVPLIALCALLASAGILPAAPSSVTARAGLITLAGLQTAWADPFADNRALWSLANEWCYYFGAPLVVAGVTTRRAEVFAAGVAVFAVYLPALNAYFFTGAGLWIAAAYAARIDIGGRRARLTLPAFAFATVLGRCMRLESLQLAHIAVGLSFLACAVTLRRWRSSADHLVRAQPHTFSLYVVHVPILGILQTRGLSVGMNAHAPLVLAAVFVAINAVAVAFYWLFERHYRSVRGWLKSLLPPGTRSTATAL